MNGNEAIKKAERILAGKNFHADELKIVIKSLKASFRFKLARKALAKVSAKYPENLWYTQQLALCTYKDEELPPASRFAEALGILESIGLSDPSNMQIHWP